MNATGPAKAERPLRSRVVHLLRLAAEVRKRWQPTSWLQPQRPGVFGEFESALV